MRLPWVLMLWETSMYVIHKGVSALEGIFKCLFSSLAIYSATLLTVACTSWDKLKAHVHTTLSN